MSQSSGTPCNFKSTNQEIRPGYNGLVFPGFVLWLIEVQKDIFNIGILLYHPNVRPLFKNDLWLTILEAMYFFLYKPFKSVTYNITYNVYTILQYHPCNWLFITILPILSLAAQAMPLFHRDTGTPYSIDHQNSPTGSFHRGHYLVSVIEKDLAFKPLRHWQCRKNKHCSGHNYV